ncbi:hypothetical protein EB118_23975, partial [bacterium]|nr:hypothetical protein [bacterium]
MNLISKELIPDKEWILKDGDNKIGSIQKNKKGYNLYKNGKRIQFKAIDNLGIELPKKNLESKIEFSEVHQIYEYPCSSKPFEPIYNIVKKLPIFTKSKKSKSHFCAGYYIIQFRKGWVKSYCPKLITLERYPYKGPFKTETE